MKQVILVCLLLACICVIANAGESKPKPQPCRTRLDEYSHVLDAYFANARGSEVDLVVLRVYGGRSKEYEIVMDPQASTIVRYTPEKSIWGNVYYFAKLHQTMDDYVKGAISIPYRREQLEAGPSEFRSLFERGLQVDTTICEKQLPILDALDFEIIRDSGRVRATITDTHGMRKIRSQNQTLLDWAVDLQRLPPAAKPLN